MRHHYIIYGYGAMGSAMAHHLYSNQLKVSVRPSPYDNINNIPSNLLIKDTVDPRQIIHVIATSHKGINWCLNMIDMDFPQGEKNIMILTKGLMIFESQIMPISSYIQKKYTCHHLAALTGPCIAYEMMQAEPTSVVISSTDGEFAHQLQSQLQTSHYHVKTSTDITGHQWAAALKNIYAILINASSAYSFATQENFNAALFHAVHQELACIIEYLGGNKETAFGLSGLGDIWVTCRKGRNGKFGYHWGTAPLTPAQINSAIFQQATVEGYMLTLSIANHWLRSSHLAQFPIITLTIAALSQNQAYASLHQMLIRYV